MSVVLMVPPDWFLYHSLARVLPVPTCILLWTLSSLPPAMAGKTLWRHDKSISCLCTVVLNIEFPRLYFKHNLSVLKIDYIQNIIVIFNVRNSLSNQKKDVDQYVFNPLFHIFANFRHVDNCGYIYFVWSYLWNTKTEKYSCPMVLRFIMTLHDERCKLLIIRTPRFVIWTPPGKYQNCTVNAIKSVQDMKNHPRSLYKLYRFIRIPHSNI